MQHSPGFLALATDAKTRVHEIDIEEYRRRVEAGERWHLVDVREDHEVEQKGRLPGAEHLSKGVVERDIEARFPDKDTPIVFYCGGGFRSAMVCDNVQKMGYTNVLSLDGGFRGWSERGLPLEKD
jgi:rhodanese-related sulfurtransferase